MPDRDNVVTLPSTLHCKKTVVPFSPPSDTLRMPLVCGRPPWHDGDCYDDVDGIWWSTRAAPKDLTREAGL